MLIFALLAALLGVAAAGAVVIPLVRRNAAGEPPAVWAALGAAGVVILGSIGLYLTWSSWHWSGALPEDSPAGMVARLSRQLEEHPQNLDGWLMLGRSYVVLREYPLAVRAYERADRLAGGRSSDALVGEAEALALTDESELDGRAGRLIERALVLAPQSGKALFFGAAVAERRGDLPLARQRFAGLLALNPPEAIRPLLAQQINAIDAKLAAAGAPSGGAQPAATASGGPQIQVNITLAPALATAAGDAPLFVFVRDPKRPGPPLAVKRLQSQFPQNVSLGAADSMLPGRVLTAGQDVEVVARIARSGSPVGQSGDPVGKVSYRVGQGGSVSVVIDHLTP